MNSKIVCGVIFVLFCVFQLGHAIKCYRCNGESSCRMPKLYECNQAYANETSKFLDIYYLNVNTNSTALNFLCMRQDLKFSSNIVKYRGCVYSHINSGGLTLRPFYSNPLTEHSRRCNDGNGCNPADRSSISMAAIVLSMVFVLSYKRFV